MNSLSVSWKRSIETVLLIGTMEFFNNSNTKLRDYLKSWNEYPFKRTCKIGFIGGIILTNVN